MIGAGSSSPTIVRRVAIRLPRTAYRHSADDGWRRRARPNHGGLELEVVVGVRTAFLYDWSCGTGRRDAARNLGGLELPSILRQNGAQSVTLLIVDDVHARLLIVHLPERAVVRCAGNEVSFARLNLLDDFSAGLVIQGDTIPLLGGGFGVGFEDFLGLHRGLST